MKSQLIAAVLIVMMVMLQGCATTPLSCCNKVNCVENVKGELIPIGARLALDLAEVHAEEKSVDLSEFEISNIAYSINKAEWHIFFEMKEEFKREAVGNFFSISVDAFTGNAEIHPGY